MDYLSGIPPELVCSEGCAEQFCDSLQKLKILLTHHAFHR
ncbi:hypothetical protein TSMEX_009447 [Taenia solium]|eukprot:TsM_000247000 transcript=TsM_000247000 gene=TsM_000247000